MSRIQLTDTTMDAMCKMAEGNLGAITVMVQLVKRGKEIDPQGFLGGWGAILSLDTHGIYGPEIWMFYKDVCGEDIRIMIGLLRAIQLGFISESLVKSAIQNYGTGIDIPKLMAQVEEGLSEFAKESTPSLETEGEHCDQLNN